MCSFLNKKLAVAVVLSELRNSFMLFEAFPETLKRDLRFLHKAIDINSKVLKFINTEYVNPKDYKMLVISAVNKNGLSLQYASKEIQKNPEIVLMAIGQNFNSIKYADLSLKSDPFFMQKVVKDFPLALEYGTEEIKRNKSVVRASGSKFFLALSVASPDLREMSFIHNVIRDDMSILDYLPDELALDEDFWKTMIKDRFSAIVTVTDHQFSTQFWEDVVLHDIFCLYFLPQTMMIERPFFPNTLLMPFSQMGKHHFKSTIEAAGLCFSDKNMLNIILDFLSYENFFSGGNLDDAPQLLQMCEHNMSAKLQTKIKKLAFSSDLEIPHNDQSFSLTDLTIESHSIFVRIKQIENSYEIGLYNAGKGVRYHEEKAGKYRTVFRVLVPKSDVDKTVSNIQLCSTVDDIYELLQKYERMFKDDFFESPQTIGNCYIRSLFVYIRQEMPEIFLELNDAIFTTISEKLNLLKIEILKRKEISTADKECVNQFINELLYKAEFEKVKLIREVSEAEKFQGDMDRQAICDLLQSYSG